MNSSSKSLSPLITAPRMTAFRPGQSPPEVRIPIFMRGARFSRRRDGSGDARTARAPGRIRSAPGTRGRRGARAGGASLRTMRRWREDLRPDDGAPRSLRVEGPGRSRSGRVGSGGGGPIVRGAVDRAAVGRGSGALGVGGLLGLDAHRATALGGALQRVLEV